MKYFGFVKEHENNSPSVSIKELVKESSSPQIEKEMILSYLKKGNQCVPLMGCVEDANDPRNEDDEFVDDSFIAYRGVLTDGEWFWPEYVINYIEKYPTFIIDQEFVKHVKKNEGRMPKLTKNELESLEKQFYTEIWNDNQ
jgi:hypothetical protein